MLNSITFSSLSFKQYLSSFTKHILLYGAGAFGRELLPALQAQGVRPKAFLDIKAKGNIEDIPIFHPEEYTNTNVTVIISIVLQKEEREKIISYLQNLGFTDIIDGEVVRAHYVYFENNTPYNVEAIQKPLTYLVDEESRRIYAHNVKAHLERNYSLALESSASEQYFVDLPHNTRFSSFVDAGAYTGDTFLIAQKLGIIIDEYYAFEPVKKNFLELQKTLQAYPAVKSTLFPAGLSDTTGTANFSVGSDMSALEPLGTEQLHVTTLDDALEPTAPIDFIKMDIEGAELKALYGARQTIEKHRPNLAICVYHYINHFWDIPNYLHNLNLGYTFYLRAHSSACMENVLYALQEG